MSANPLPSIACDFCHCAIAPTDDACVIHAQPSPLAMCPACRFAVGRLVELVAQYEDAEREAGLQHQREDADG